MSFVMKGDAPLNLNSPAGGIALSGRPVGSGVGLSVDWLGLEARTIGGEDAAVRRGDSCWSPFVPPGDGGGETAAGGDCGLELSCVGTGGWV